MFPQDYVGWGGCWSSKVHEERLRGYEDKEKEKYLLLTNVEWLVRTKKKDADDSSSSSMSGRDNHNKDKEVVDVTVNVLVEEIVTIPHKPI